VACRTISATYRQNYGQIFTCIPDKIRYDRAPLGCTTCTNDGNLVYFWNEDHGIESVFLVISMS
jgi:hypothetical protein